MSDILINLCGFSIELVKVILCTKMILKFQFRNKVKFILPVLIILSYVIISISIRVDTIDILFELLNVILLIAITLAIFRGNFIKTIVVFFISYLAICIVDIIVYLFITRLPQISPEAFSVNDLGLVLGDSVSLILLILIILIQKKIRKRFTVPLRHLHWSYYILLSWTLICFALLISYIQFIEVERDTKASNILVMSLAVVSTGIVTIIIMLTRASYSRDKFKALSIMNQEYLNIQQQYYSLLSEKNEDIRRFQHDIKNHFLCIQALSVEGKLDEIKRYINQLTEGYQVLSYKINTGSNIVDAIISDMSAKRPELNIIVNGFLPYQLHISAMDICIIFSNILSNAAEAVSKLEDNRNKEIIFEIKSLENNIYIKATNPVKEKVLIDGNTVNTTKNEGDLHGFGLGNIQKCAEKYHGSVEISSTEKEFMMEIVIRNVNIDRLHS